MSDLYLAGGVSALAHLRENGLQLQHIRAMLGASGGPKWLVLNQIDRFLAPLLAADPQVSLDLLGTSIGSWRFACYGQTDPLAAFDRFEAAYFEQSYSPKPAATEISRECGKILDALLGTEHKAIVQQHSRRLHTITNRYRSAMLNQDGQPSHWRLGLSAMANLWSRNQLRHFFERVLFAPEHSTLPFQDSTFTLEKATLSAENIRAALMATASIPLLMESVCDIPGTSGGACVDGGIIDYHFDTPFPYQDGIVLYPHFTPRLIPGWFDKLLPWRKPSPLSLDNILLISPSREFIARLPHGKIPDRSDFTKMDSATRDQAWRTTLAETERLAAALAEKLHHQRWDDVVSLT